MTSKLIIQKFFLFDLLMSQIFGAMGCSPVSKTRGGAFVRRVCEPGNFQINLKIAHIKLLLL